MAFVPSFKSRLLVGSQSWSAYTRGFTLTDDTAMLDVTTIVDTAKQYIPGLEDSNLSLDLLLDASGAATSQFALMNTWKSTPQAVTVAPEGVTAGSALWLLLGNQADSTISAPVADVVSASMNIQADGGAEAGVSIEAETAITTDTNGASVDNGAATSNGGVAHLHVTAFSGLTNDVLTIEHSTNNSVWATLGTFATVSGLTSERLVIASGTTVNRYLRIVDNVTGTGSITRAVSFARR